MFVITKSEKKTGTLFMLSMLAFLLLIAVQTFALELLDLPLYLVIFITLLPILPLLWAFEIYRARFLQLDEYLQRKTGESLLWTIGIVSFSAFGYGMLEYKLVMPEVSMAFLLPLIFGGHGIVLQILLRSDAGD